MQTFLIKADFVHLRGFIEENDMLRNIGFSKVLKSNFQHSACVFIGFCAKDFACLRAIASLPVYSYSLYSAIFSPAVEPAFQSRLGALHAFSLQSFEYRFSAEAFFFRPPAQIPPSYHSGMFSRTLMLIPATPYLGRKGSLESAIHKNSTKGEDSSSRRGSLGLRLQQTIKRLSRIKGRLSREREWDE